MVKQLQQPNGKAELNPNGRSIQLKQTIQLIPHQRANLIIQLIKLQATNQNQVIL
jgi:hypothetical protein